MSETIGLTWSDVDMKNREIHVGGQLVYYEDHSDAQITMNIYNHIAEMSHVENEMSKMNLPETVPAVV